MQHRVAFLQCEPPRDSANTENQDQVERSKGNSSYKNVKAIWGMRVPSKVRLCLETQI